VHHPYYHCGYTSADCNTNPKLQNIATCFQDEYPDAVDLQYSDMSLVWGGLFDYCADPCDGGHWAPPHSLHRVGKNCDCTNCEEFTGAQSEYLKGCVTGAGGQWALHNGNHWHLTFCS